MNGRAKFDAASFILAGEIHNCTNKHTHTLTHKQTVTDISTPYLSVYCMDKNPVNIFVGYNFLSKPFSRQAL